MRNFSNYRWQALLALFALVALAVIGFQAEVPNKIEQFRAEFQRAAKLLFAIKSTHYPYVYGVTTHIDGDRQPEWFSVNRNTFAGENYARITAAFAEQSECIEFASGSTIYWSDGSVRIRTDITATDGLFACHERVPQFDEVLLKRGK
jgi:hypothetical protein